MAKTKRIGVVDLAQLLGLSTYAVSRALNGHPDVSDATRKRVIEKAKEVGYTPHWLGQRLRSKRTDLVAFMLTPSPGHFVDSYFLPILTGASEVLAKSGYSIVVASPGNEQMELDTLRRFVEGGGVDAVILARVRNDDFRATFLQTHGFPFASLGRSCDTPSTPYVDADHFASGHFATKWLIERGHKRIALINTPKAIHSSQQRQRGWQAALEENGLPLDDTFAFNGDYTAIGAREIARKLLAYPMPPTAIICGNDDMAIGAADAVRERDLVVGSHISIIGCDDIPLSSMTYPPVATFRTSLQSFGEALGNQILTKMKGGSPKSLLIKPEFIERASAGPCLPR